MENFYRVGEAGKTLGQHYVEAMDALEAKKQQQTPEVPVAPEAVAPVEKPKAKKWFEEEGTFPYNEGDMVQIIAGKDLHLRTAIVVGPSAKKGALKAQLIHPVKGTPQKTQCSFDFDRLRTITSNGAEVNPILTELPTNDEQQAAV